MYAVIQSGGKQYRVAPGDFLQIEKLSGEIGNSVSFDQVLFYSKKDDDSSKITIGKPYIEGACVTGQVVGQGRGDKIIIVKMKRRKQYRRTKGHRQEYTQVLVTGFKTQNDSFDLSEDEKKLKLSKFHSQLKSTVEAQDGT
jgi:large subunit ribosomal protein L21